MSAVINLGKHMPAIAPVRDAINERAHAIGASEAARQHAVAVAVKHLTAGRSPAWAIAEACRDLRGKAPAVHAGYPTPPAAA